MYHNDYPVETINGRQYVCFYVGASRLALPRDTSSNYDFISGDKLTEVLRETCSGELCTLDLAEELLARYASKMSYRFDEARLPEDHRVRQMDFTEWLLEHRLDDNKFGDLARDIAQDKDWIGQRGIGILLMVDYMREQNACEAAIECLVEAWACWYGLCYPYQGMVI